MWTHEFASGTDGSVLATGGGLVFLGGGDFQAFNALTGKRLWQIRTNYGRTGVPTTYVVNGVQYIAVQSGAPPRTVRRMAFSGSSRSTVSVRPPIARGQRAANLRIGSAKDSYCAAPRFQALLRRMNFRETAADG